MGVDHVVLMVHVGFKSCLVLLKWLNRHLLKSLCNLLNHLLNLPRRLWRWRGCQYNLCLLLLGKLLIKFILLLHLSYFLLYCHFSNIGAFLQMRTWNGLDAKVLYVDFVLSDWGFRFLWD
jgi:hypothetical protein